MLKTNPILEAVIVSLILTQCIFCSAIEFNRRTTGAAFSAYVKKFVKNSTTGTNEIPGWKTYSLEDIKTMLQVINTKFSKVATFGSGADNVKYFENQTYFESNGQVWAAEAAALINKENGNRSLTLLQGVWLSDISQQMNAELRLALECIRKSNGIYPGTVEALLINHNELSNTKKYAGLALRKLREVKREAEELGLRLGTRQNCKDIAEEPDDSKRELTFIRREILNLSDIIICEISAASHNLPSGAENGFITVGNDLLGFRNEFQEINPRIEVMGQTGWPSKGKDSWENIVNLQEYWQIVSKWSAEKNMTMWMFEAFDNPWKEYSPNAAYYGWWKLADNSATNRLNGYIEKIYAPPEEKPNTTATSPNDSDVGLNPWAYVGIAIGVIVAIFILALILLLFMRVNKLQDALTTDDIKDFMYGVSDEAAAQQQGGQIESALKFPYDKSYEISKEKLEIKRDALLGSGQFGAVYKAVLDNDERMEVALKMAKSDCPKSALKGLLSEIKILTYLGKHPNIVSIHGAYTAELVSGLVYVATELCTMGSLEGYLRNAQTMESADRYTNGPVWREAKEQESEFGPPHVTFFDMIRWSHEIACGMEYLGTKHVVHADLSTRNVLLTSDKTAKITDFGLSRRLYDYTNYVKKQQEPLPWRWMSIESLKRLEFSAKSDVWSYGVTLWEIFAMGDLPYPGLSWNLDFVENLTNGLRMKSPPHATPQVYALMVDCWHIQPNDRPTFTDLKLTTQDIWSKSTSTSTSTRMTPLENYANIMLQTHDP